MGPFPSHSKSSSFSRMLLVSRRELSPGKQLVIQVMTTITVIDVEDDGPLYDLRVEISSGQSCKPQVGGKTLSKYLLPAAAYIKPTLDWFHNAVSITRWKIQSAAELTLPPLPLPLSPRPCLFLVSTICSALQTLAHIELQPAYVAVWPLQFSS